MTQIYNSLDMKNNRIVNARNVVTSDDDNQKIKSLTQQEYNDLLDAGTIDNNTIYIISDSQNGASGGYTLPAASTSQLGGVKVGDTLQADTSGTLSVKIDNIPTKNSTNAITSGAVWSAIQDMGSSTATVVALQSCADAGYILESLRYAEFNGMILFQGECTVTSPANEDTFFTITGLPDSKSSNDGNWHGSATDWNDGTTSLPFYMQAGSNRFCLKFGTENYLYPFQLIYPKA